MSSFECARFKLGTRADLELPCSAWGHLPVISHQVNIKTSIERPCWLVEMLDSKGFGVHCPLDCTTVKLVSEFRNLISPNLFVLLYGIESTPLMLRMILPLLPLRLS
jgi:hypothetical protein